MKAFRRTIVLAGFCCIIIAFAVYGLVVYQQLLMKDMLESVHDTLNEIMIQQRYNVTSMLEHEFETLELLSTSVKQADGNRDKIVQLLQKFAEREHFHNIYVSDFDGVAVDSSGESRSLTQRNYFEQLQNGENVLTEPTQCESGDMQIFMLSTPIMVDGEAVGFISLAYETSYIGSLFMPYFDGYGYDMIVNSEGKILSKRFYSDGNHEAEEAAENLLEMLNDVNFVSSANYVASIDELQQNLANSVKGQLRYTVGEKMSFAHHSPLDINGWHIFSFVPDDIVVDTVDSIMQRTRIFNFSLMLLMLMLIAHIMYMHKQNVKLKQLQINDLALIAETDALTGLYNRRFLDNALPKLVSEAFARQLPLASIMIDIDYFKLYNDNYGHHEGDEVLKSIADAITTALRQNTDIVCRYGGEEIIVLLPNTDAAGAIYVAEKIAAAVNALMLVHDYSVASKYVTVSQGLYSGIPIGNGKDNCRDYIANADAALYDAKNSGRNKYCVYESQVDTTSD